MIKNTRTCLFFPFHLESSCQGAQNNASGADGEGRRSRAGKPRFQTRCLCQSCSSAETTSWGGPAPPSSVPAHGSNRTSHTRLFIMLINLASASRDPIFFTRLWPDSAVGKDLAIKRCMYSQGKRSRTAEQNTRGAPGRQLFPSGVCRPLKPGGKELVGKCLRLHCFTFSVKDHCLLMDVVIGITQ